MPSVDPSQPGGGLDDGPRASALLDQQTEVVEQRAPASVVPEVVEQRAPASVVETVVCVDFGSTFTKASLVDLTAGRIVAAAEHPTTIETDVLDGFDACLAALLAQDPRAAEAEVLACSSAGGGLRIAVVGAEELVTAEAGRRVALSSGGKVVSVSAAASPTDTSAAGSTPTAGEADVVLLTGGTDGGNAEVIVTAARDLVAGGWTGPVVVAGNLEARAEVTAALGSVPHVVADNVVPRIGVLAPGSARMAVREVFLSHVIGGKHLSERTVDGHNQFTAMVRGATPDVVLAGVELLARGIDDARPGVGDVVVVDVGGATTDVHSVVEIDPEDGSIDDEGLAREVVAGSPVTRTVEGDLGMRWSAVSTAQSAGLTHLSEAARRRHADPGFVPGTDPEREEDVEIATAAVGLALRRHAGRSRVVVSPEGRVVERSGTDLRRVHLVVGSGGVLRHGGAGIADRVLGPSVGPHRADQAEGWQLPEDARVVIDQDYVLAAAGLLREVSPDAAYRLARSLVDTLAK
ncbi:glutamate mutase L [Nocardioides sp.]|uniref:glutamate mutase L n=1 Tax=Nocardioides sp. TaxID=35761 RepID=UPI003567FA82